MDRIEALQIAARCLEIIWFSYTEQEDREKIAQAELIVKDMIREGV